MLGQQIRFKGPQPGWESFRDAASENVALVSNAGARLKIGSS